MRNLNRVILEGRLTSDPSVNTLRNGTIKTEIRVANDQDYKDGEGKKVERAFFINCEAWAQRGQLIADHFHKGDAITVEGKLCSSSWKDEQGNNKYKMFVTVENIYFPLGKPANRAANGNFQGQGMAQGQGQPQYYQQPMPQQPMSQQPPQQYPTQHPQQPPQPQPPQFQGQPIPQQAPQAPPQQQMSPQPQQPPQQPPQPNQAGQHGTVGDDDDIPF